LRRRELKMRESSRPGLAKIYRSVRGMGGLPRLGAGQGELRPQPGAGIRVSEVFDCRSWRVVVKSGPGLSKISRPVRGMGGLPRLGAGQGELRPVEGRDSCAWRVRL
jgi:hypothetical protein